MKKLIILLYLFANSISYSYADSSDDNYWAGINAVDIEFGSIYLPMFDLSSRYLHRQYRSCRPVTPLLK